MTTHLLLLSLAFVTATSLAGVNPPPRGSSSLLEKPAPWFATNEAKSIAAAILSYQSDYGGWPKSLPLTAAPYTGRKGDLKGTLRPTFDNGATTDDVRFMARMYLATKDASYLHAVENGIDYILISQYRAGGWPQFYPPERDTKFNEASTARILKLLQEITSGGAFDFLDEDRKLAVKAASQRGSKVAWEPKARIALAGDSTVTDSAGWGFGFKKQVRGDVLCENIASGGQSSKSFRDAGRWKQVLDFKPTYVLIQFGHNDMPGKGPNRETDPATTYAENLTRFVTEARAIGAQPILVTSLTRRIFEANGKMRGELAPYAEAARKVAAEQRVPLIDLYALSIALVEKLGPAGVAPFEPMDPPKPTPAMPKPEPRRDGTHLNARGSIVFGEIIAEELARILPETRACLRGEAKP